VIKDVEKLAAEAKLYPLGQSEVALKRNVRLRGSKATQHVTSKIALLARRRRIKSRAVEDLAPWILRTVKQQTISHVIGRLHGDIALSK